MAPEDERRVSQGSLLARTTFQPPAPSYPLKRKTDVFGSDNRSPRPCPRNAHGRGSAPPSPPIAGPSIQRRITRLTLGDHGQARGWHRCGPAGSRHELPHGVVRRAHVGACGSFVTLHLRSQIPGRAGSYRSASAGSRPGQLVAEVRPLPKRHDDRGSERPPTGCPVPCRIRR